MRLLTRRHWALGLMAAAALPAGLRQASANTHTNAKTAARRIVSIGGALTETLYALGAQADLVGADTTSLFPQAARELPRVGYARALSAEGLLSLRPSLVVATQDAGPPMVLKQLEAARVPLVLLRSDHRFEDMLTRIQRLAELTDRSASGQALAARLQQDWQSSQALVQARQGAVGRPLRVLFVLSHSMAQVQVSGRGTAADAMLAYAGVTNAVTGFDGYKPLTPEAAIAAAPDVILATDQGLEAAGAMDGLLRVPGLAQTPAGRARRVASQDALLMLGFGPRLPQAVAELARALHGAMG